MSQMDVFVVGAVVALERRPEIRAVISGIAIYPFRQVQYRCVWWDGTTRHEEWLHEMELRPLNEQPSLLRIGFLSGRDRSRL